MDVGDYPTDPWTFTDTTGNYNNANGTVHDHIAGVLTIAPPESVVVEMLTSFTNMFLFIEKTNFTLTSPVLVDVSAPVSLSSEQLTSLTIPAGTLVNSTYLHHDQIGSSQNTQNASITFETDVLGVIVLQDHLVASNGQLGYPLTQYQTGSGSNGQGYEWTGRCSTAAGDQDQITLSADQVTVCTNVYGAPDDIRILTRGSLP